MVAYDYNRTAAKKPVAEKPAESTLTRKPEVERAIKAIKSAIEAVHDCAPSGRDYQEGGEYDSKGYAKAMSEHGKRVDTLHDIAADLNKILEGMAK